MSIEHGPGPEFLKQKYYLHNSNEVASARERREFRDGEQIGQNPDEQIQNYLDRFKEITDRTDPEKLQRGIEALKKVLHDKFIVKSEEIPESYWESQRRIIRERGQGADLEQVDWNEIKRQNTEAIIADQTSSLDNWIDYLTSSDATYPDWLKYWAFRSITQMGGFDKERHAFSKRSTGTTKPFPDINREALAYVLDAVEKSQSKEYLDSKESVRQQKNQIKKLKGEQRSGAEISEEEISGLQDKILEEEKRQKEIVFGALTEDSTDEELSTLLRDQDFAKLYAWAIEKVTPASVEQITNTEGEWVKYKQGSDHMPLVQSLQGHGTGWCTAGESTAEAQLRGGDFYVYYSHDKQGQPTIPRAAIRMENGKIGEVRGIAPEQNLDPYIADVVKEKLEEFPDGKAYEKKTTDMQMLTAIEHKSQSKEELSKDELIFLYEIDSPIEGFGYQRDPRIEEIRNQRDPKEDAPVVLDCQPEEIAWSRDKISDQTKAYVGPLFAGVFKFPNIESVFTSFPEGIIRKVDREIGGLTKEQFDQQIMQELKNRGVNISSGAQFMENSSDFTVQENREIITLVHLKVRDLFNDADIHTTEQIFAKAEEFGLELCPPEVGPRQRLADTEQPLNQWYSIAMKPIASRDSIPCVFRLSHDDRGLWLGSGNAEPSDEWDPHYELVFRLRKFPQEF